MDEVERRFLWVFCSWWFGRKSWWYPSRIGSLECCKFVLHSTRDEAGEETRLVNSPPIHCWCAAAAVVVNPNTEPRHTRMNECPFRALCKERVVALVFSVQPLGDGLSSELCDFSVRPSSSSVYTTVCRSFPYPSASQSGTHHRQSFSMFQSKPWLSYFTYPLPSAAIHSPVATPLTVYVLFSWGQYILRRLPILLLLLPTVDGWKSPNNNSAGYGFTYVGINLF